MQPKTRAVIALDAVLNAAFAGRVLFLGVF